jgi:hypothetical protein
MTLKIKVVVHFAPMTNRVFLSKLARWAPLVIGFSAFLLYLLTAGPSIVELFDDSLEFQLVGPTFGIAHPTGYPLYVILGGLWSRLLPIGNWAWRMNALSALFGAIAVGLLFALTRRMVTTHDGRPNQWAGLAAALCFGLGSVWWSQATIAEVYTLHIALVAAILSVTVGMNQSMGDSASIPPSVDRRMTWLFLLFGLGLAHHRTTLLLAPGVAIYLLWSVPGIWRPRRIWLLWALALVAPLLLYLFIPLRASMGAMDLNGSYVNDWGGFWRHVLASVYAGFFSDNSLAVDRTPGDWLAIFRQQVGWLGPMLGLLGLAWLVDRQRRPAKAWIFVLIVLLTNLIFALSYRVGDVEVFLLPVFYCAAIFVGGGVGLLGRLSPRYALWANIGQASLILLLAVSMLSGGLAIDRSQSWAAHDYAVEVAKIDYPTGSHVVGLEGEMTALRYMQMAEGLGTNATLVVADDPEQRREIVRDLVASASPTFLTRELPGIETEYSFSGVGPLIRVSPRGESQTASPVHPLNVTMVDEALSVEGYDLSLLEQAGGPMLQVTYYWRPSQVLERIYKVSLRVQTADGLPLMLPNGLPVVLDEYPVRQAAFTNQWLPDERISDVHYLPLPPSGLDGATVFETIVYDAETVEEVARWQIDLN